SWARSPASRNVGSVIDKRTPMTGTTTIISIRVFPWSSPNRVRTIALPPSILPENNEGRPAGRPSPPVPSVQLSRGQQATSCACSDVASRVLLADVRASLGVIRDAEALSGSTQGLEQHHRGGLSLDVHGVQHRRDPIDPRQRRLDGHALGGGEARVYVTIREERLRRSDPVPEVG